jgi:hypothetical protein
MKSGKCTQSREYQFLYFDGYNIEETERFLSQVSPGEGRVYLRRGEFHDYEVVTGGGYAFGGVNVEDYVIIDRERPYRLESYPEESFRKFFNVKGE